MDFTFSAEQAELRGTARRYLEKACPEHRIGEPAEAAEVGWREITELGWLDTDLTEVELAILAEETGYALFPLPWFATMGLAALAYREAGLVPARPTTLAWLEPNHRVSTLDECLSGTGCVARRGPDGVRLHGVKRAATDARRTGEAVVVARAPDGAVLCLLDLTAPEQRRRSLATVDRTRPMADLVLSGAPARQLAGPGSAQRVLAATRLRALCLLAAEAVGVGQRALDLALAHARSRRQFGRPVGSYQAVAHPAAEVYAALEMARSLAYRAAWCVATADPAASEAVTVATVASREAAERSARNAIQTLGATGFAWEHPAHRLLRRVRWIAAFDGASSAHRARLAEALLTGPLTRSAADPAAPAG